MMIESEDVRRMLETTATYFLIDEHCSLQYLAVKECLQRLDLLVQIKETGHVPLNYYTAEGELLN